MFTAVIVAVLVIPAGEMKITARFGPYTSERVCRQHALEYVARPRLRGWTIRKAACVVGQQL